MQSFFTLYKSSLVYIIDAGIKKVGPNSNGKICLIFFLKIARNINIIEKTEIRKYEILSHFLIMKILNSKY